MKNEKILILRSRIIALLNVCWCSAAQLPQLSWAAQNSILPLPVRNYSTLATPRSCSVENFKLDPNWVTGFVDGEGCFELHVIKRSKSRLGWQVMPVCEIELHRRDVGSLEKIKAFFKDAGGISKTKRTTLKYRVSSVEQITKIIIPHFEKYPLKTQKQGDYLLFKEVIGIMIKKEHLTLEGLSQIVAIRALMNRGLSEKLSDAFPDVVPVVRSLVENQKI